MGAFDLLVGVIFLGFLFAAINSHLKIWRYYKFSIARWLGVLGLMLVTYGVVGFGMSFGGAVGGLGWLPKTIEWPVVYAAQILPVEDGRFVVALPNCGRVQVYDTEMRFLCGWQVDASGGSFKLLKAGRECFDLVVARSKRVMRFDVFGKLLSQTTYASDDYDSFPKQGVTGVVPTSFWLWGFTSPFLDVVLFWMGLGLWSWSEKQRR
jgi:hypothetical protein